jgi:hypothetical protein
VGLQEKMVGDDGMLSADYQSFYGKESLFAVVNFLADCSDEMLAVMQ